MTISVWYNPLLALTELFSLFIFNSWTVLPELRIDRECSGTNEVFCGSVFCGKKKTLMRRSVWITVGNWGTWLNRRNNIEAHLFVYKFTMFSCPADEFSSQVAAPVHLTSCVMLNQFLKRQACTFVLCSTVMQNCWKQCGVDHTRQ